MDASHWIDTAVEPPTRLPRDASDAIAYLSRLLGVSLYVVWTPIRLAEHFASLIEARAAVPEVFALLCESDAEEIVVQYWKSGNVITSLRSAAPSSSSVLLQFLRSLPVRFKHQPTEFAESLPSSRTARDTLNVMRIDNAIEHNPILLSAGRYFNRDQNLNMLGAATDAQAISAFLRDRTNRSPHTARAYRTELRRLVFWCEANHLGPLSDLTRQDLLNYRDDLAMMSRHELDQVLSPSAQARAINVVKSMYKYLTSTGYQTVNPALELGVSHPNAPSTILSRLLSTAATDACDRWLDAQLQLNDVPLRAARHTAILALYRFAGIRVAELAPKMGYPRLRSEGSNWAIEVLGKGMKARVIPLPEACVVHLRRYRLRRGLPAMPDKEEAIPIISARSGRALGTSGLYREIKACLQDIANSLPSDALQARLALERASPHYLRHAYVHTLVVRNRVPLPAAQMLAGHASIHTTAGYARTDQNELRKFVEQCFASPRYPHDDTNST